MNIVFLMAGRGSRFKEVGYHEPKSLIDVRGKPMYAWAVDSLSFIEQKSLLFVCLKDHADQGLTADIKKRYGSSARIHIVDQVTQGAAETALLARKHIDIDDELIVSNADQYFTSKSFKDELSKKHKAFSGLIPVFEATHPRWSFAKVNGGNLVTEVAEKVPISNKATVGVYYFKKGTDFVWSALQMIGKDIRRNNEFYVCPVFNELIGRGDKIKAVSADSMWSMGTPEDVEYFKKYYKPTPHI